MINTFFGANLRLASKDLHSPEIHSLLLDASIITVIDPPPNIDREREGKTVVWDAGVRSILGIDRLKRILENVDYLVINEVEIKNLTGEEGPVAAREAISRVNDGIFLVAKLGERDCMMIGPQEQSRCRL